MKSIEGYEKSETEIRLPRMEIERGLHALGFSLYIEELNALVVADLHLGYEQALEESGIFLPAVQYKFIKEFIVNALRESGADKLIVLGDVKHEFGSALRQEWNETLDLFATMRGMGVEAHVVRGNHDNFLIPVLKRLNVPLHDPYFKLDDHLFAHGHKELPLDAWSGGVSRVVIAHEHPAVILRDELGVSVKLKCFLVGRHEGIPLVVVPALSPLMPGSEINVTNVKLLSPILRRVDLDSMRVYVVDLNTGIYDFGTVHLLKKMLMED